jgi:lactoylglutathione lyase
MNIDSLFEIAVKVKNLEASAIFYEKVLGFVRGLLDEKRRWLFLWVGGRKGMVVLQEDGGDWPSQHFAFRISEAELAVFKEYLEGKNILVEGPVSLNWMNAASLYFSDPDGHALELCAIVSRHGQEQRCT